MPGNKLHVKLVSRLGNRTAHYSDHCPTQMDGGGSAGDVKVASGQAQKQALKDLHLVNRYLRSTYYVLSAGDTVISEIQALLQGT